MLHCKAVNPNKAHFEEERGSRPLLGGGGWGRRHLSAVMTQQGEGAGSAAK